MTPLLMGPDGQPMRGAEFSSDGCYRYELRRLVDALGHGEIAWVMLNPSTADEHSNDPTIRRCIDFSRRWGFRFLRVVNICPVRSTNPKGARGWGESPVDGAYFLNLNYIERAVQEADVTVMAWGSHGWGIGGDNYREEIGCHTDEAWVLGWTANGQPRHPLYIQATTRPVHAEDASRRWLRGLALEGSEA